MINQKQVNHLTNHAWLKRKLLSLRNEAPYKMKNAIRYGNSGWDWGLTCIETSTNCLDTYHLYAGKFPSFDYVGEVPHLSKETKETAHKEEDDL